MNIYIYGNSSFKKDIHKMLKQSGVKNQLDDNSTIKDIDSLDSLKNIIKNNPRDIYLIDDEKIIKKNLITNKIKFLVPKDGIEEEYLLEHGIADLSVDSLEDIPKYILLKYEQEKAQSEDIQNSIIDIVDEAYNENVELDEELSLLLSSQGEEDEIQEIESENEIEKKEEFPFENKLDFNSVEKNDVNLDRIDEVIGFEENVGLNNITHDYDDKDTVEDKDIKEVTIDESEILVNNEVLEKGENMNDEFFELNSLKEEDILSALNDNNSKEVSTQEKTENTQVDSKVGENLELSSSNASDISELITKLLNNKTLEITVKIKD